MLESVSIENFKSHKHTELQLANLNIFTGLNGMGKSSVIQSLLLLRQSFPSINRGIDLNGFMCKVGNASDIDCWVADTNKISFKLAYENSEPVDFSFIVPEIDMLATFLPREESKLNIEELQKLSIFNTNFQYLSAFRFGPIDTYSRDTLTVEIEKQLSKESGKGEYAVHYLDKFGKEDIPVPALKHPDSSDLSLSTQVEYWLKEISPNIRISIEKVGADYKLKYKFNREGNTITPEVSALNTGFGITYVLPLLIAILSASPGSLLIFENPEAHIHPGGQAKLMELINLAASQGVQFIIETHSDHIINGALIAVKQSILTSDKTKVYYFNRNEQEHTTITHLLDITKNGKIKNPPAGFFDQFDKDLQILTGF